MEPARRRGVVVRPGGRAGLPGALPVHLPRAPRHARRLRLAAVAHRDRRLARVRRSASAAGSHEVRTGTKVTSVLETADGVEVTDGNGAVATYDAVVDRHPPEPGAGDAGRADRRAARGARPRCPTPPTPRCCTPTPRCCRGARDARASWNFLRPRRPAAGQVTVTYDLTRLQRLDTDTHYLVTLGGERPRRPGDRDRPDGVRAPALHPRLGRRPAPAARARTPTGSPSPAPTTAGASTRTARAPGSRAAEHLGLRVGRGRPPRGDRPPTHRASTTTTIRHTRRTPFRRTFSHRSHTWLVDLDDLPDHGAALGPVRGARPPRRPATATHPRQRRGVPRRATASTSRGGRVLMAAQRRGPSATASTRSASSGASRPPASSSPRGRRGAQHLRRPARLPRPPRRAGPGQHAPRRCTSRRSTAPTARYELAVPVPGDRLARRGHAAHRRRRGLQRVADRDARSGGDRRDAGAPPPPPCAARCSIRAHGIWLWAPPAARPAPTGRTTRKACCAMTLAPHDARRSRPRPRGPGWTCVPAGPRAARLRRAWPAGSSARPSAGSTSPSGSSAGDASGTCSAGAGRPMIVHRPEEFFARLGRRPADRLRRGLPDRRLGRRRTSAAS